jgi:phage gpG-like protein
VITVKGLDKVKKRFAAIELRCRAPEEGLKIMAVWGWKDILNHFKQEEGPDGRWAPVKEATLKRLRKGKKKRSHKILQDKGDLRNRNVWRIVKEGILFSNNIGYAGAHNDPKRIWMPKRKFLWLSETVLDKMRKYFLKYIAGK